MNENKEIEEMAKKIDYAINNECKLNNGKTCEDCSYNNSGDWECQNRMMASYLYGEGYRNCKDKVVLAKEEYEELRQERSDYITELQETHNENCRLRIELEDIRKETAREILERGKLCMPSGLREWIEKQYGVKE